MLHKNLFQDPIHSIEIFSYYGYFIWCGACAEGVALHCDESACAAIFKGSMTFLIKEMRFVQCKYFL